VTDDKTVASWTHTVNGDTLVIQINCACGLPVIVVDPKPGDTLMITCECGRKYTFEMPTRKWSKLWWLELWANLRSKDKWLEWL
jgi:hypothetical protein